MFLLDKMRSTTFFSKKIRGFLKFFLQSWYLSLSKYNENITYVHVRQSYFFTIERPTLSFMKWNALPKISKYSGKHKQEELPSPLLGHGLCWKLFYARFIHRKFPKFLHQNFFWTNFKQQKCLPHWILVKEPPICFSLLPKI